MYTIKDGYVVTDEIAVLWPCLTKINSRYNKYTAAFEVPEDLADDLLGFMDERLEEYLAANQASSELPSAVHWKAREDGTILFSVQNRQRPTIVNAEGTAFTGVIGPGSTVRLVMEPVCYTNNANGHVGVSLRVIAVEVVQAVEKRQDALALLGHTRAAPEAQPEAAPETAQERNIRLVVERREAMRAQGVETERDAGSRVLASAGSGASLSNADANRACSHGVKAGAMY